MRKIKLHPDHIRAALRTEEKRIKELLDAIELNDAPLEVVVNQIQHIEEGLRQLRLVAA